MSYTQVLQLPLVWFAYYCENAERELRSSQAEAQGQVPDKFGPRGTHVV